jgi:hypothetical protein
MKKLLLMLLSIQILFATGMNELSSGDTIETSIKRLEKHIYKITVPKNRSLRVELSNLDADIDLYLRAKEIPSIRVNDCYSSNSNLANEECILNNSDKESDCYILVYGYEEGNYKLNVSVGEPEKVSILSEEGVSGEVAKGAKIDYKFSAKKGEVVTVKLFDLTADADLRVKVGRKANRHTFDCKSTNGGTKEDSCSLVLKEDAWVYVQVDGYRHAIYKLKLVNPTSAYLNPSDIYLTTNGNIITFTYTDRDQYLATVNLATLELVDNIRITREGVNSWAAYKRAGSNLDLFYTVHETPEQGLYTYYHVANDGTIAKIQGINPGGSDYNFIWKQGVMSNNRYYITYLEERASGNTQYLKFTKKIYDISNLPNMPLVDTIITEEERPI